MRLLITNIIILLSATLYGAVDALAIEGTFEKGVLAFEKKQYDQAKLLFESAIKEETNNFSAYYNLGLTHLEIKEYGSAIWAFEKARLMDPGNDRVNEGLKLAHTGLNSEYTITASPVEMFFAALSPTVWAIVSIICSIVLAMFLLRYIKQADSSYRGLILVAIVLFAVFLLLTVYAANCSNTVRSADSMGVVICPAPEYHSDLTASEDKLPEGTSVIIQDSLTSPFIKVSTKDGKVVILDRQFVKKL